MKNLLLILVFTLVTSFPGYSQTKLIKPPLKLEFGMSYSEVKAELKRRNIKLEKRGTPKKQKLPKGFKVSTVAKYKLLGKKTDFNRATFNADGELCDFQIELKWSQQDKYKALSYYNTELKPAIIGKYSGEGFKEHKDPNKDGVTPELAYRDEVGNQIGVYFTSGWTGFLKNKPAFIIIIQYSNEEIINATKVEQKTTDEI